MEETDLAAHWKSSLHMQQLSLNQLGEWFYVAVNRPHVFSKNVQNNCSHFSSLHHKIWAEMINHVSYSPQYLSIYDGSLSPPSAEYVNIKHWQEIKDVRNVNAIFL